MGALLIEDINRAITVLLHFLSDEAPMRDNS
jgi:hypothetical protein